MRFDGGGGQWQDTGDGRLLITLSDEPASAWRSRDEPVWRPALLGTHIWPYRGKTVLACCRSGRCRHGAGVRRLPAALIDRGFADGRPDI